MVQCSAVCSDTVHFSAVYIYDCSAVQCSAMQCSVVIQCSAVCSGAFIRCPAGQEGKVRGSSITANVSAPENKGTGLGWRPNNRHIFMSVHNLVIVPILQHCQTVGDGTYNRTDKDHHGPHKPEGISFRNSKDNGEAEERYYRPGDQAEGGQG